MGNRERDVGGRKRDGEGGEGGESVRCHVWINQALKTQQNLGVEGKRWKANREENVLTFALYYTLMFSLFALMQGAVCS